MVRYTGIVFTALIFYSSILNGQELMVSWTKAAPSYGKEFTAYSAELQCLRFGYRRMLDLPVIVGAGIDVMSFRKADIPERFIRTRTLYAEIGYPLRDIPGLDVDLMLSVGVARMQYKLDMTVSDLEGSSGLGLMAEPNIIMSLPVSRRVTIRPSFGYAVYFDKMGFRTSSTTLSKRLSEGPVASRSDSRLELWTYRIGFSVRLGKIE